MEGTLSELLSLTYPLNVGFIWYFHFIIKEKEDPRGSCYLIVLRPWTRWKRGPDSLSFLSLCVLEFQCDFGVFVAVQ